MILRLRGIILTQWHERVYTQFHSGKCIGSYTCARPLHCSCQVIITRGAVTVWSLHLTCTDRQHCDCVSKP